MYVESCFEKTIRTVRQGGWWIVLGHFGAKDSPQAKLVAARNANLVHADIGRYWLGPERANLKTFVKDALAQGAQWIIEGKLKRYINQVIKLDEAENALEKMKHGISGFGKVVVKLI